MSGANTYTGATIVSAGTLAIGDTSALLTTTGLTLASGTLLQPNLDGVVIRAPITLGASGTTATISAPNNNPGSGVVSTLTLRSVLAGSGNITFSSSLNNNALSTVYLGAPSTYAGTTLLDTAGTSATQIIVKLGIPNALPTTTVVTIDGQAGTGTGPGRFAELNLNGFNQQLAGLTNTPRSLRAQRVVNSNISAAATLTINNSSSHNFSGNLGSADASGSVSAAAMPGSTNGNNFGLTKSGAGIFTLASPSNTNTFTGAVAINAGVLKLGANSQIADAVASFTINGGTFDVATFTEGITPAAALTNGTLAGTGWLLARGGYACTGTNTISAGLTVRASDTNSGLFNISSGTTTVSGVIFSDNSTLQGITKTGSGTLTLTGANTYTGGTTVTGGTLALGASNVLANTTAVSIGNATLNAATFTDTVGTLGITGNAILNLGTGGTLAFAGSNAVGWTGGTLNLTGAFVSGASLRFGTNSSGLTPTQLALISAPGFNSFSLNASGYLTASAAVAYASWKTTNAPSGTPGDDFDADGVSNGVEFVLGGTSTTKDLGKLPTFSRSGGNMIFSFQRAQSSIDGITTLTIEVTNNLGTWPDTYPVPATAVANNPGVTVVKDSPGPGTDTVTLTLPVSGLTKFARLKVTP